MFSLNPEFGLPDKLVEMLEPISANVKDNRIDALIGIIGMERGGKSTLSTLVAKCFAKQMNTDLILQRDFSYDGLSFVENCSRARYYDSPNPMKPIKGGKHYIKVYDEGVMGGFSREWQSTENTILNQCLATIGYKYLVMIISIPSWWMLDPLVREHRVSALIKVHAIPDQYGMLQKGFCTVYNAADTRKIYKDRLTRRTIYPRSQFAYMPFSTMEGTEFWKEYENESSIQKERITNDLLANVRKVRDTALKKREKLKKKGEDEDGV